MSKGDQGNQSWPSYQRLYGLHDELDRDFTLTTNAQKEGKHDLEWLVTTHVRLIQDLLHQLRCTEPQYTRHIATGPESFLHQHSQSTLHGKRNDSERTFRTPSNSTNNHLLSSIVTNHFFPWLSKKGLATTIRWRFPPGPNSWGPLMTARHSSKLSPSLSQPTTRRSNEVLERFSFQLASLIEGLCNLSYKIGWWWWWWWWWWWYGQKIL